VQAAKGAARIGKDPETGWIENRNEYMRRIEGVSFGSSKAQGIVRENRMYHEPLGITVAFPRGWTVENQPDQVLAYTPAKDSFVIMRLAPADPKTKMTPREALMTFARGLSLSGGESIVSNDMQGYTAVSRSGSPLDQGQGPLRFVMLERGDSFYVFYGGSKSSRNGIPEADGLIQGVAQTLRSLKPSEFPLAEPYRVKVLQAKDGVRLGDFVKDFPDDKYQLQQLELMNGVYPNGNPQPGQLFKVVE
jgi:predicted Zn-dependent protease